MRGTALTLMRDRNFRIIWSVGILAEVGRRNEILVWSLLLFKVIEAPASYLMLLWVFNNLPRPFVSPIAGYIADRFPRQRVMLLMQAVNVVVVAGLLTMMLNSLDSLQAWHVFLVAFIQGTTKAIEDPSRRTGIFDIVGRDRIVNAMSLDVIAQNVGKMIGPVVGGLLIQFSGYPAAFIFLLFVHADNLLLISRPPDSRSRPPGDAAATLAGHGQRLLLRLEDRIPGGDALNNHSDERMGLPPAAVHTCRRNGPAGRRGGACRRPGGRRRLRPPGRCSDDGVDAGRPVPRTLLSLRVDHRPAGLRGLHLVAVVRIGLCPSARQRARAGGFLDDAEQYHDAGFSAGDARPDDGDCSASASASPT